MKTTNGLHELWSVMQLVLSVSAFMFIDIDIQFCEILCNCLQIILLFKARGHPLLHGFMKEHKGFFQFTVKCKFVHPH